MEVTFFEDKYISLISKCFIPFAGGASLILGAAGTFGSGTTFFGFSGT